MSTRLANLRRSLGLAGSRVLRVIRVQLIAVVVIVRLHRALALLAWHPFLSHRLESSSHTLFSFFAGKKIRTWRQCMLR
jgi:hypothetical protein